MVTKKFKPLLIICFLIFNFSCHDTLNDPPNFDSLIFQEKDFLSIDELNMIVNDILDKKFDFENGRVNNDHFEKELSNSLIPLVENGKNLHNQLLNNLSRSGEINKLSLNERKDIEEFSDQQLAELSFAINYAHYNISIDPKIRSCLNTAIGIAGIYDLVRNTRSLGTVQTTIKALRLIGRRAMGWVGVGLMILDFTDCYYAM